MPPHLQKEIRADKRLWPTDETPTLRAPRTWEESRKVVLEFEQREAAHKAVANAAGELADAKKELAKLKAEVKAAAKAAAKATANQTLTATKGKGKGGDADKKICFHFRDHGNCPKGDSCPYSHDKELRKRRDAGHQQTLAASGKGGGKAGGKGAGKTAVSLRPGPRQRLSLKERLPRSRPARCAPSLRRTARAGRAPTVIWCTPLPPVEATSLRCRRIGAPLRRVPR